MLAIPTEEEQMKSVPYLNFNGKCAEAFRFYAQALGREAPQLMTFAQSGMTQGMNEAEQQQIMHGRIDLGGGAELYGSDAPGGRYQAPQGFAVALVIEAPEEADRVFAALSEGGKVTMPIAETFWAKRFGMLTDRFGIPWMIDCEKPMQA
jgi:PhnB protein